MRWLLHDVRAAAQHRLDRRVAGEMDDPRVEVEVEARRFVELAFGQGDVQLGKVVLERRDVVVGDDVRGHPRGEAFERIAHLVRVGRRRLLGELPRMRGARLRALHIDALAGADAQHPERLERGQRLAQRRG
jgi:hypothetical protein